MSRSRKRHPVIWYVGQSNKQGKRQGNKRFRRLVHQRMYLGCHLPNRVAEVMDFWCMPADGKRRLKPDDNYYERSLKK